MKFFTTIFLFLLVYATNLFPSDTYNRIVDFSVHIDSSDNKYSFVITLNNTDTNAAKFIISRKKKTDDKWILLDTIDKNIKKYIDTPPPDFNAYEYRIIKTTVDTSYFGYGYVYTGYNVSMPFARGIALLLIDETLQKPLAKEIERYKLDLIGDGYKVIIRYTERAEYFYPPAVSRTKLIIEKVQNENPNKEVTLILLGRVPVPYSGNTSWDGHQPDHQGSWPADVYYGISRSYWHDMNIFQTNPTRKQNKNIPFDGKFDQSVFKKTGIPIGRIDMYNLPDFKENEIELIRKYLNKNHAFRHRIFIPRMKALLNDGFKTYLIDEAFAADAWINFSALLGTNNVDTNSTYRYDMQDSSFIWSYGNNMGAYDNIYHTAYSNELAEKPYKSVFTMLLGSYAGDWDTKNNVLRSTLASAPSMLTAAWAGRPFWFFHHMGLGEPISYSALISQNNKNLYPSTGNKGLRGAHIELLGDPTLRMLYPAPPLFFNITNDTAIAGKRRITLKWEQPDDKITGYYLFRANDINGNFKKINNTIITDKQFTDYPENSGYYVYMLRSVKKEIVVSGSYYNLSQGVFADTKMTTNIQEPKFQHLSIHPNPAKDYIYINLYSNSNLPVEYSIYNINGKNLLTANTGNIHKGLNTISLKFKTFGNKFSSGLYFLKIRQGTNIYFGKFLIID